MATIAENLQTIKDSTDAIKQAIIDKGGTISGDITTWADAINGISEGSGELDLIKFYFETASTSKICPRGMTWIDYTGSIFDIKDKYYGTISISKNETMRCSYGYIMNPDTGDYTYPWETIYPVIYSIQR